MGSIIENKLRVGNFTSSDAVELVTIDKRSGKHNHDKAMKYVAKKNIERKLCRSIGLNKGTNSTRWGNFMEMVVNSKIGMDYTLYGDVSFAHPKYSFWVGSPDTKNIAKKSAGDIKCFEPENFAEYLDVLYKNDVELFKAEYPKEYWQLVSNACILGMENIEAIVYMPYESDMDEIREMASNYEGADQWKYRFIAESPLSELPYLPNGNKFYKDLNIIQFAVPEADKFFLESKVIEYGQQLIKI